jgi:ABC-type oligopeptide transport system ATPase subunit
MLNPDTAIDNLRQIIKSFEAFCKVHGDVTEADTRANVIDKILTQVCGWPDEAIKREPPTERGYMDYCLMNQKKGYVVIEAKREGKPFTFPHDNMHRSLKLSGSLLTDKIIKEAIIQVRTYCDNSGVRYAIATNGYAWIVFRAIREDIPWREGQARIFPSLEFICENFTEFWRLLSYRSICEGSLDYEFGSSLRIDRNLHRVVEKVFNVDRPLERNRLHAQIHSVIRTIFEDIAEQDDTDVLTNCYVFSKSLEIVAKDLEVVIKDSIPEFLKKQGAEQLQITGRYDAGQFGSAVGDSFSAKKGRMFLLLGGIGSGKTTFLRRYQRTVGRDLLQKNTIWFHIDFLNCPLAPDQMEEYVWSTILSQVRKRFADMNIETRQNMKGAFADKIKVLNETVLKRQDRNASKSDEILSEYLQKWSDNPMDYTPRILRQVSLGQKKKVVLFIDNVDQLKPEYQAMIFMLAQRITNMISSITVVSLREESYYAAAVQSTFTAYTNRKFHIASPRFRPLIGTRIKFALKALSDSKDRYNLFSHSGIYINKQDLADFLKIVQESIFGTNKNIARFVDAICYGNMRLALQMFATFLSSGAVDVDKMLRIYRRDGNYYVAYHEWVKSIMLGDRHYYKELGSPIMNIFDCGTEKNSSHFTCLRILRHLMAHRSESSIEGQGYCEIIKAVSLFEDLFDNREDFIRSTNRLIEKQLVEVNTKSLENITGASHMRVTSAGWYYYRFLANSFCYLDLVLQDTPINDVAVRDELCRSVQVVDNLYDREDQKIERVNTRFSRVEKFLKYLELEENEESDRFSLEVIDSIFRVKFVPYIIQEYKEEKDSISERILKNREKYEQGNLFALTEEESTLLDDEGDIAVDHDVINKNPEPKKTQNLRKGKYS